MADPSAVIQKVVQLRDNFVSKLPQQGGFVRGLREFTKRDPITGVINMIGTWIKGNKYANGERVLGEKYMLYVIGYDIHDRNQVPDEMIAEAKQMLTLLFGITIDSIEDIDVLSSGGAQGYINRHKDRPDLISNTAAIENAAALRKTLPNNDMPAAWQQPIINWVSAHDNGSVNQVSQQVDMSINNALSRFGLNRSAIVNGKGDLVNPVDGRVLVDDKTKNTLMIAGIFVAAFLILRRMFR